MIVIVQPFSDEEVRHIAEFASISEEKVRGVAWLAALKILDHERFKLTAPSDNGTSE